MHNTPRQNLEFQLTSTENNLRYILGEPKTERNLKLIKATQSSISQIKAELGKAEPQRLACDAPLLESLPV